MEIGGIGLLTDGVLGEVASCRRRSRGSSSAYFMHVLIPSNLCYESTLPLAKARGAAVAVAPVYGRLPPDHVVQFWHL